MFQVSLTLLSPVISLDLSGIYPNDAFCKKLSTDAALLDFLYPHIDYNLQLLFLLANRKMQN